MASNQKSSSTGSDYGKSGSSQIASDGFTNRSAPIPILRRATNDTKAHDDFAAGGPPSPTASISGDKYILVRAPKPQDRICQLAEADVKAAIVKTVSAPVDLKSGLCTTLSNERMSEVLKSAGRNSGIFRTRMVLAQATQATAAPQQAVIAIDPTAAVEYSAFAALFSEFRVLPKVLFKFVVGWSAPPNTSMAVWAYDPVIGTQLSSVVNGAEASQHYLFGMGSNLTPTGVSADGCYNFKIHADGGVVTNGSVAGLAMAGQWQPTSASAAKYGYVKSYIPGGGSGITSTAQSYLLMDVEFRNRI